MPSPARALLLDLPATHLTPDTTSLRYRLNSHDRRSNGNPNSSHQRNGSENE